MDPRPASATLLVMVEFARPSRSLVGGEVALAGDRMDVLDRFEALHQPAELGQAADLHRGGNHRGLVVVSLHCRPREVDLALGNDRCDVAQQAGTVPGLDLDADRVELPAASVPIDLDDPLLVGDIEDVRAARSVHRDPLTACDIAADEVARYRLAALRDLSEHTPLALDADLTGGLELWDQRNEWELAVAVGRLAGRHVLEQDGMRADIAVSDSGVEIIQVRESKLPGELQDLLVPDRGERPLLHPPEFLVEQLLALADVFFAPLLLEPDADLLRGARGLDKAQPVAAGPVRGL